MSSEEIGDGSTSKVKANGNVNVNATVTASVNGSTNTWEHPSNNASLSFTKVRNSGPPARNRAFPDPRINRGEVGPIIYYDMETEQFKKQTALFRVTAEGDRSFTDCAYLFAPDDSDEARRDTQMGSVRFCRVVVRQLTENGDGDDESMDGDDDSSTSSNSTMSMSMSCSYSNKSAGNCSSGGKSNANSGEEMYFHATNRVVAVKISCKRTVYHRWANGEGRNEDPWQEVAAAQLIGDDYPNLLGILDALQDSANLYSVMPYCPGGDLYDYINSHDDRIEDHARHCFTQVLKGLDQLQVAGIFHRDLSIENIMIYEDRCVIIDFGMCLRIPTGDDGIRRLILPQGACGKVRYMAPETFANRLGDRYAVDGPSCDLWSAGVILFVLLTGKFPYLQPDMNDVGFTFTISNIAGLFDAFDVQISELAVDLLQKIFQLHPSARITLAQVMEHPWVNNVGA